MSFHNNAIFWVEVGKISPNPYQPRREFDEGKLRDLADSIRQYGVLQPLVVTRKEVYGDDGSMVVEYELIAGERRLRAARLASVSQVPVVIRSGEEEDNVKLELAIIENLQREDLNPVDRARAFARLADEFGYKHTEIGKKIGRSREYVSNTIRLLGLPDDMLEALAEGKMREGHSRALLMLTDRPDEQTTLFKEIVFKKVTVRDAEAISRRIAHERARKFDGSIGSDVREFEEAVGEKLGTRVYVHKGHHGGRVVINFTTEEDLQHIMQELKVRFNQNEEPEARESQQEASVKTNTVEDNQQEHATETVDEDDTEDDEIYSISNFSI